LTLCICLSAGSETEGRKKRSIGNLWDNFVEVTKLRDVVERMRTLLRENDEDMNDLQVYLKEEEFHSIATCLRGSQDYVEFYNFLESNGMDLQKLFQWVSGELEWGEYHPPANKHTSRYNQQDTRTLGTLWEDLVSIIPYSDYLAWFLEQYAINPDMQALIGRLQSKSSENIKDYLYTCEGYRNYRCKLINGEVDLVSIEEKGCSFLGWSDCTTPECPVAI